MEFPEDFAFNDVEYQMEEALQMIRRQLITILEDDQCLLCLQEICRCPDDFHPERIRPYQLFNYAVYSEEYQVPPPASRVPKPYWIHGNWVPNEDLTESWEKIKAEDHESTWAKAKEAPIMIPNQVACINDSLETCKKKVNDWFDALKRPPKKVRARVSEEKKSTNPPPVWPPMKDSPWCHIQNTKHPKEEVNNSVAEFFQKFATQNMVSLMPDYSVSANITVAARSILLTKMDIGYESILPSLGSGTNAVTDKIKCAI